MSSAKDNKWIKNENGEMPQKFMELKLKYSKSKW